MNRPQEHVLSAGGLRVRLFHQTDRFAHAIELEHLGEFQPLLESLEGSSADDWPASPPLQSLHVESRPGDKQLALLVGMAGKSHWSLSIELDPHQQSATFDVACRVPPGAAGRLGSSYRVAKSAGGQLEKGTMRFGPGDSRAARLDLCEESGPSRLGHDGEMFLIEPAAAGIAGNRTIRWGYRIALYDS